MITTEELRQLLESQGYGPEEIDDIMARHFRTELDLQEAADAWAALHEQIREIADRIREIADQLGKALLQAFAPAADIMKALEQLATEPAPPKKKPPRAPRYAGPQNKGRAWNRQPPRLARSCCRKCRR